MFDLVRKHMKAMQFVLFLLIVPSFLLFGLEGYNRFREKGEPVAKVAGREITQTEWDVAHKNEVDRLRQSMPTLDAKLLDSPAARYATLERLVRDRVLVAAAAKSKLETSDQRLARELQQNEMIASLRGPDGKLDMARYRQLVGAQGMSPEMFEARMRDDLSSRQVLAGLGSSGFTTPAQASPALGALHEKREAQIALFSTADHAAKVNPTDADIETFYKANPTMFQAAEQAAIEYLVLDLDTVMKGITINEADLKTYFEQNIARLTGQEERRASHILIAAAKGAPQAERDKAKAKASELLAAVKKSPESFADLARKNSQDPGSAPNGGDLDFFTRGAMTKPFEDAVFAMKKGDTSGVVESDFGYHIIRLTDVKVPKQRTYEEMKPGLEAELKKQQAQRKFAETAETFSNTVYEQADSLKPAADKLKLEIKTAQGILRTPQPGATGALANLKFLGALFAPDSVEKKRNTEAVEVGPSQMAAGRVTQYTAARTLPLAEVKDRVRERILAARGAELAAKEGREKLAVWKASPGGASLPAAVTISRMDEPKFFPAVIEAVLRADPSALPAFVGVELGAQGYAVARVNKVLPAAPSPQDQATRERGQYAQWWTNAEGLAYYNLLKDRFKTQILVPAPANKLGEEQ